MIGQTASASVPFFITKDQRQQLHDLGYNRADINSMTPQRAIEILGLLAASANNTESLLANGAAPALSDEERLSLALEYMASGLATLPIKTDGSKQPATRSWKQYEQRLPTEGELQKWFGNGKQQGIALIGGKVSGNLEILDFDAPELIAEWRELVEDAAPGLLDRLPQVRTPADGLHVFYRCMQIAGNTKLAQREIDAPAGTKGARTRDGRWFKVETTIETRGEGGYVITAGSPAACHPSGKPYRLINGDLKAIPEITQRERAVLLACARSFNAHMKTAPEAKREGSKSSSSGLRPGDDFNQRGDVRALLEKHDWKYLRPGPCGELWQRPGGDHTSATLFPDGSLYVFSSNADPFDHERKYDRFSIYAILEHDGDWKAAAKALAQQGFGETEKTKQKDKPNTGSASVKEVGNITFKVDEKGVWAIDENDSKTWVCSKLVIEADTRDERNVNWGRLLRFPDRDGVLHTWSMPMSLLSRDGGEYREHLLNLGLDIGGRRSRALLDSYLNVKPDKRALCVIKPGWHRNVFVLPDEFIGGEDAEPIYLQTFTANHLFREAGSSGDWREKLGIYCSGNNRLLLAVSVGFCAPLLEPLQGESGGWHFTSDTSVGKSTALYVAGSVHGGGGDKGFLRRWRATINGLESVAESHHDSLLCLDEIAECKPEDVNEAAYMLSNGQGKARQARAGGLRATPEWRVVFLSSGEISLADHVAQSGRRVRGGQEVRVINLPADAGKGLGLFEDLHDFQDGDAFARYLQRTARECYGAPIRAFLHGIVGRLDKLRQQYKTFSDEVLKEMLPDKAVGAVSRVAHRFALAAFAGELATEMGLTGWEPDEATEATKALFQTWLDARGTPGSTDEEAAVRQVRAFLEQHGSSRFQRLFSRLSDSGEDQTASEERPVINRAGYIKPDRGQEEAEIAEYFILPEVFRGEVCKGFDSKIVIKALESRELLLIQGERSQTQIRTPEGRVRVYAVSSKILER